MHGGSDGGARQRRLGVLKRAGGIDDDIGGERAQALRPRRFLVEHGGFDRAVWKLSLQPRDFGV